MEVDIDHLIDLPCQDVVYILQQDVTGTTPLFDGRFDKPLRDYVQAVVWEFPRSSPVEE